MHRQTTHRIILLGPMGSGKGTQAELISQQLKIPSISTGDIYRREMANNTDLGAMISSYYHQGLLVPDDITNALVEIRLDQPDCEQGFILDGYPRNINQAKSLERMTAITDVISVDVSDREAIFRIHGRVVCNCGLSYHLRFNPPKKEGVCDGCGGQLYHRKDDDAEQALRKRLEIYHQEVKPLVDFYKGKNILHQINGEQDIQDVHKDIMKVLKLK
ncbi:MAG: adenylate kinase [Patescibacteria group bacterium]